MKINRKGIRRKNRKTLLFLPIFAFFISGLAFANQLRLQASAADVSANFIITEAHIYKDNACTNEVTETNGTSSWATMKLKIHYSYASETPIANGDTVSFMVANNTSSSTQTTFNLPNMASTNIVDANGNKIGSWQITNKKVTITFSDAAVGRTSLEGTLITPKNLAVSQLVAEDIVVPIKVGPITKNILVLKGAPVKLGNESKKWLSNSSNSFSTWGLATPGITINELYDGHGAVALSSAAKLSNIIIEDSLTSGVGNVSLVIDAAANVPYDLSTGTGGSSDYVNNINATSAFTKKTQAAGQSYEDFKASLNELEYGIYEHSDTSQKTVVINIGSQPSSLTYADALRAAGRSETLAGDYLSSNSPITGRATVDAINALTGPNNIIGGKVAYFRIYVTESRPTATITTPISNTMTIAYDDANGEHIVTQNSATGSLVVGSSEAIIKGEAKLYLRDKATLLPISGANVKLQIKDGTAWEDVPNGAKTTGADGSIQILSLDSGATYRWVQTSFLDHYLTDSYLLYSDEAMQNAITEFVLPEDSGVTTYATNEKESFTITYKPGEHGNFADIVFNKQYYGTTTPQPTSNQIVGVTGWTFSGWSPSVSNSVNGDAIYVAQWQRQTTSQSVTSVWVDADNEDNLRPNTQRVQLLQNGNNYGEPIDLTANDHWIYTWSGLPKYNENGTTEYSYTVTNAGTVTGYTTAVGVAANGTYTITNTHMPKVSVKVTKVWEDNNNSANIRPANITVTLKADDVATNQTITLTDNKLTDTFTNLDKYSNLANKIAIAYTVSEPTVTNYKDPVITGDAVTGFTITNTAKRGTLTVHHYLKNSTTIVAPDETFTKFFGEGYNTSYKTNLANYIYDSTVGTSADTFAGDTTVTFYYIYRTGTVTTHHYIAGSTTRIVDDQTQTKNYGETYDTSPLNPMPDNYLNYTVVNAKPEGYTGTVSQPNKEVTYFYQMIDVNLSSEINIAAPKTTASKTAAIDYTITYNASVKEYIGNAGLVIKAQLPYPIKVDESNLAGGTFDTTDNSITWPIGQTKINTYTAVDQTVKFNETISFSIVYEGAQAKDTLLVAASATLSLANDKSSMTENNTSTIIKTPAKIIFRYIDQKGKTIQKEVEDEGFVGDLSTVRPPEIPGYRLVEDKNINYQFSEEVRTITYKYVKIENPVTSANNLIHYFVAIGGLVAALGCGIYVNIKRNRI